MRRPTGHCYARNLGKTCEFKNVEREENPLTISQSQKSNEKNLSIIKWQKNIYLFLCTESDV